MLRFPPATPTAKAAVPQPYSAKKSSAAQDAVRVQPPCSVLQSDAPCQRIADHAFGHLGSQLHGRRHHCARVANSGNSGLHNGGNHEAATPRLNPATTVEQSFRQLLAPGQNSYTGLALVVPTISADSSC